MRHRLGRMPLLPYPRQPWGGGCGQQSYSRCQDTTAISEGRTHRAARPRVQVLARELNLYNILKDLSFKHPPTENGPVGIIPLAWVTTAGFWDSKE